MIGSALVGIGAMIGHHGYNTALEGRTVGDPEWPQRAGIALSTFGAFAMTRAVVIAYQQHVWVRFILPTSKCYGRVADLARLH